MNEEALEVINPVLVRVARWARENARDMTFAEILPLLTAQNPAGITRPEVKYPFALEELACALADGADLWGEWDGRLPRGGRLRSEAEREALLGLWGF